MLSSLEDRTRLAEIEAQIRDLERTLVELRAEKMLVQERLSSCTYPVLTLPNEIVSEIFIHFLPLRPLCPPLTGRLSPTTLTQICRRWRQVAQATPELWRAILFADDRIPLEEQFLIFDLWLSRSRGYPYLSVWIDLSAAPCQSPRNLSGSRPSSGLLGRLDTSYQWIQAPSLDGPMPLLRFLDWSLTTAVF
ncbi:hypothetical protein B0H13DRAFT_296024 [Mycena leptocephala]|nr:hypothetical protein B0H13DRAFT_296024 [Mycena leptocephala]